MQTQLIRTRRNRTRWITAAFALGIPLYVILFQQHGVTQAQEGELTETATPTYPATFTMTTTETETETSTPTLVEPPSATLSLTYSPTNTLTRTPRSITNTPTITSSPTKTDTRTKTYTPYINITDTSTPTETVGITPVPPSVGSCPAIPYPVVPPLPGGRGLYPGWMSVTYFNDIGRMDYQLDNPINWGTLTAPSLSTWYLSSLDFNWNGQPPTAGVNGVFWSACYQGYLQVPAAGTYTFYLDNLDDGGILYVGDLETPVISSWLVQGPHFYQADVTLSEGIMPIRLLYAQGPGTQSSVTLAWSSALFAKEVIHGSTAKYATLTPTSTPTATSTPTVTRSMSIVVTNTNDSGPGSLRQAIADIAPAGVITFDPSLSGQTITLASTLLIDKDMTIDGTMAGARVQISGNNSVRIFAYVNGAGGALYSLILKNGYRNGPSVEDFGGALYAGNGSDLAIQYVDFHDNHAYEGGALYAAAGAQVTLLHVVFDHNTAQWGGAVLAQGEVNFYGDCVFSQNDADGPGGAVVIQGAADGYIGQCTFSGNTSGSGGGAIYLDTTGTVVIENNAFIANNSLSAGAMYVNQSPGLSLSVRGNLFSGNYASGSGGALLYVAAGTPDPIVVENNTFYRNFAAQGGAVQSFGYALIRNNTFFENDAPLGGASVFFDEGSNTLYNNIMTGAVTGGECSGIGTAVTSGGSNLVADGSALCRPSLTGDPMLGPLADNGGPTLTMTLDVGSPAFEAGDDAHCPDVDARGIARPQGAHCDLGAVEMPGMGMPTHTFTPQTPTNTPSVTETLTDTPTITKTPTKTDTPTPVSPTRTATNTPTETNTRTDTPTITLSKTSTAKALPDLVISSVDYSSPGYNGQCLTGAYNPRLRVKVGNIGPGDAGPFVVDVMGSQLSAGGLGAGEEMVLWFNRSGGSLTVTVDINNSVLESNESNNTVTFSSPTPSRPPNCTFTPTITSSTLEITPTPTETKEITDTPSSTYTNTKSLTATPTSNREAHVRVVNASGEPLAGIPVSYIYIDGGSEKGASADNGITAGGTLTDSNGEVMFVFQFYPTVRFVATRHGREFWSGDCFVPARCFVVFHTPDPVDVTVLDSAGNPQPGLAVRAYSGNAYAGVEETTNAQGVATLWLPAGNYHFRAVKDGIIYWSSTQDLCVISGCSSALIRFQDPVTVTVLDLDGQPQAGVPVMVFDGTIFTDISGTTNAQGQVSFILPDGAYRFRAAKNNRFFWSGGSNHCAVPGCTAATITVDNTVIVTVLDSEGNPESGLNVLVYDGSTYAGYAAYTNTQGQATLSLPAGSYRFRVAKGGTAFWSGTADHCTVPGCTSASITVNLPVVVTVLNLDSQPEAGLIVQAYNGATWAGYTATTDAQGQVSFTLPDGNYRFRVYKNSRSFWSGAESHCAVPGCTSASVTVDNTVVVTVLDSVGNPETGLKVQAYNGSTYAGYSLYTDAQGRAAMTLPAGNYRFRVVKGGTAFWSGTSNHCTVPGCSSAGITVNQSVTITVLNLGGQPEAGISVVAYNGSTYAGYSGTTDAQGRVTFTMVDGSYRFRAAKNNRFFWSGTTNHCTVPGCASATITVDNTVVVTVLDADGNPEAGLNVLAYNGSTYAGFAAYTNAQGQASLALPAGNYRFRVAKNGTAFWSGESNHCTVPGCVNAGITTDGGGIAISNSMDIFGLAYTVTSYGAAINRGRLEEYIPNPLFMYI